MVWWRLVSWIESPLSFFSKIVTPRVCLENTSTEWYGWHVVFSGFDDSFFQDGFGLVWFFVENAWTWLKHFNTTVGNCPGSGKMAVCFFSWETWQKMVGSLSLCYFFMACCPSFCEVLREDVIPPKTNEHGYPLKGWFPWKAGGGFPLKGMAIFGIWKAKMVYLTTKYGPFCWFPGWKRMV